MTDNEKVKIHREPNYWHFEGAGTGQEGVDICREYGISQPTFYQWKSKYSGLDVNQLKRVKELEAEVPQYKKLVSELTLTTGYSKT